MRFQSLFLFVTVLLIPNPSFGQDTGFYYKYDFETFIRTKTQNADSFMLAFKENIKYPALLRENKVEGVLRVIVYNTGSELELLMKREGLMSAVDDYKSLDIDYRVLEQEVNRVFINYCSKFLKENSEKYLTEFSVLFKFQSVSNIRKPVNDPDFTIIGRGIKTTSHKSH